MATGPELSSVNTRLQELTERVTAMAEQLSGTERDAVAQELYEVERVLQTAARRLEKVVNELS